MYGATIPRWANWNWKQTTWLNKRFKIKTDSMWKTCDIIVCKYFLCTYKIKIRSDRKMKYIKIFVSSNLLFLSFLSYLFICCCKILNTKRKVKRKTLSTKPVRFCKSRECDRWVESLIYSFTNLFDIIFLVIFLSKLIFGVLFNHIKTIYSLLISRKTTTFWIFRYKLWHVKMFTSC